MNNTREQEAFIASNEKNITLVKSFAGTGKSYTLKQYCKVRPKQKIIYFVYNSNMYKDAKKSFAGIDWVYITTFHALAYKKIGYKYKERLNIGELSAINMIPYVENFVSEDNLFIYASALYQLLKDFMVSFYTIDEFTNHKRKENIEWSKTNMAPLMKLLPILPTVWKDIILKETMPMSHDAYLKLYQLANDNLEYDHILIDEAQDLAPVMINIILKNKGRKIFVGDPFQSIYQWRGAVDSLEYIEKNYSCSIYYLSQSFRCPPQIAEYGNWVIKQAGSKKDFYGVGNEVPKDPITKYTYIARTNAALFNLCIENLDKKIYFVGGFNNYNFYELLDIKRLQSKQYHKIQNPFYKQFQSIKDLIKYAIQVNNPGLRGLVGIVMNQENKAQQEGDVGIYKLIASIKESSVRSEKDADFRVVTAHKSKGLEWDNVVLLDDFPFFKPKIKNVSPIPIEEYNLLYVAITRAKNTLQMNNKFFDFFGK